MRFALASLLTLLFSQPLAAAEPPALGWNPARTFALVVGVLHWPKKAQLDNFESLGRCDETLAQVLKRAGVPADQLVYLKDNEATLPEIRARSKALFARTRAGDSFIFYYEGHGFVVDDEYYFANYDCASEPESWWSAKEVVDSIEEGFHGDRALLMADCCHSGALVDFVSAKPRRVNYAAMASALAGEESTGNWTFTEAMIAALGGDPTVDADGDGRITAGEMARYATDEMTAFAEQHAAVGFTGSFTPSTVVAATRGARRSARSGERVEVEYYGEWSPARLVETQGNRALVHWVQIGYHRAEDEEWVPLSTVRPLSKKPEASDEEASDSEDTSDSEESSESRKPSVSTARLLSSKSEAHEKKHSDSEETSESNAAEAIRSAFKRSH